MFSWFRRRPKIPDGMVQLNDVPVAEDGRPQWNGELENATQRFGSEFLVPFMIETSPGMCIGGFAAKAILKTPIRTYEARATLIQRKNDEFRTNVLVTAPSVPAVASVASWDAYAGQYNTSLPREQLDNLIHTIRQLCQRSHTTELQNRGMISDGIDSASPDSSEFSSKVLDGTRRSIERSVALLESPWDQHLYNEATKAKEHISLKAVQDEYERLVLQKLSRSGRAL